MVSLEEIEVNGVILALAIIMIVVTLFWYFNALGNAKQDAYELIESFEEPCEELAELSSECEFAEETVSLSFDVLCGPDMEEELESIKNKIENSYNLWEIQYLAGSEEMSEIKAIDQGLNTLGEIKTGNEFFASVQKLKAQILFNKGVFVGSCNIDSYKLGKYAECDLKNVRVLLPSEPRSLANKYLESAETSFRAGDYLDTISYATGATAYQDKLAREQYLDLVESWRTELICLD